MVVSVASLWVPSKISQDSLFRVKKIAPEIAMHQDFIHAAFVIRLYLGEERHSVSFSASINCRKTFFFRAEAVTPA
jgi:hypothetical protein